MENNYEKLSDDQKEKFEIYMKELIEWNKNINLTAITEENEIVLKHFIDSMTISDYIKDNSKIIDIGTGAGFPGIPLKIKNNSLNVTLVDSLNKRINFLNNIINKLNLDNICAIHSRAEELGHNKEQREQYDYAVSRAVANLSTLLEYLLPFVKVGGFCICMKGPNIEQEINNSEKALKELGGKIEKIENFTLPGTDITRNIILIKKINTTKNKYPRKAGTPAKEPL